MFEYKGYHGVVEFDHEFEFFAGHVVDLKDHIYFEGRSVEELRESLQQAVDLYLDVCERNGEDPERPFSGNFRLRLDPELHRDVAVRAASEGQSLNAYIANTLKERVSA